MANSTKSMINITQTFLPPLEEYQNLLEKIWTNKWLTNRGDLVLELENKLKDFLEVRNILITNNGTVPLQISLKLLGHNKEILTTPFSYVATTSSIIWENCTPVFVDIDPETLTIDENLLEASLTNKTSAILATHVFGNPCNIEVIEKFSQKHNLKVIYDGAHCFGVKYKNQSIFNFGDISTCSFHATKLFHTGEGGAVFTNNNDLFHKIFYSHNFGHNGPEVFHGLGINGKISELQAAMGLAVLPYINSIISSRKLICDYYNENLIFKNIRTFKLREKTQWNYSYYAIICKNEEMMLKIKQELNQNNIFPRRYFYPSLNKLPYITGKYTMPISEKIASTILCLPLYVGLTEKQVELIVKIINQKSC